MKKMLNTLAVMLLLSTCALQAHAQMTSDTPEQRAKATDRYLKAVPTSRMIDDMVVEMTKQVPADQKEKFAATMKATISVEVIERVTRESMVKVFTAEEINALADFYGSANGASAMRKFGAYMGLIMPAMQREMQQAMMKLQAAPVPQKK